MTTLNAKSAPIWRVKFVTGNAGGSGSSGDWQYYEAGAFERMGADILEALINRDCGDGRTTGHYNLLSRIWRRYSRPDLVRDHNEWRRYQVVEVAFMRDNNWVKVEVDYQPPSVTLKIPGETA